ncbi:MAG: hypothetical protein KF760_30230 [Candidatus Eremiobacteraeota bacterium]|nr:hypothetical protein [Candidatus Eremiobacteraeota bacterium]MCW5871700.1 hypothetical protein [Candidatus Eremiobacteraeota bacterium]
MSVIQQLPRWAQGPTEKFVDKSKIDGTETRPLDQDSFDQSLNHTAGVLLMCSNDEVPGEDQAMGQPGLVKRNGATVYFDGDLSDSRGQVEAIVLGRRKGVEYVSYVHSRPDGFSSLKMVNDDGSIELNGTQAQRKAGALQGYLLAGTVYE